MWQWPVAVRPWTFQEGLLVRGPQGNQQRGKNDALSFQCLSVLKIFCSQILWHVVSSHRKVKGPVERSRLIRFAKNRICKLSLGWEVEDVDGCHRQNASHSRHFYIKIHFQSSYMNLSLGKLFQSIKWTMKLSIWELLNFPKMFLANFGSPNGLNSFLLSNSHFGGLMGIKMTWRVSFGDSSPQGSWECLS